MVGNRQYAACWRKEAEPKNAKRMTPKTSHSSEKENRALATSVAGAIRGWMSEKSLPPAHQGKCFLLTSPLSPKTLSSVNRRDLESKFGGSFSE
jgi:hypothetical protein